MNNKLSTYQRAQIDGLSQRDLVVTCYKGTIKYLADAEQRLEAGDIDGFGDLIEKAHRVIVHLYTTLDMELGGEIAQRLADLYIYIINQIYLLNATKNPGIIHGIVKILTTLKEGWEGISVNPTGGRQEKLTAQPTPTQQAVSVQI